MADKSKIEWTEATWNPITGCRVVSRGCRNCYAMKLAGGRLRHHPSRAGLTDDSKAGPVWNGEVRFYSPWLDQPLRWKRPRHIFVCAHGDLFYEGVPDDWIDRVFAIMGAAEQHTFQVLTKRPERMRDYMRKRGHAAWNSGRMGPDKWPAENIFLGVSVEDQTCANERIPALLDTPAAVRFLSCEPLLGPLDLSEISVGDGVMQPLETRRWSEEIAQWRDTSDEWEAEFLDWFGLSKMPAPDDLMWRPLDWVIAGGESGPKARPSHPDWFRGLRNQCQAAGVPFFFKQWGEYGPAPEGATHPLECHPVPGSKGLIRTRRLKDGQFMQRVGKKAAGRLLDGREHNDMPSLATEARP
ncbi:DUF5131 family protein [Ferruginivarius sediminum]|uniref:Phage Gp37/Gp68 family protein n=1 Tax=Ferruginivarius sediminum TaxID=2661937 RepID=A0A369T540_9PROT|nr:phage Gp37/Gp68 family protein [Ferruginivarius sediminum]RDD60461.1 phage Gp37/Gp68 family protein [Ferruginivarius sediminum]